jgi:hypothetical protein
MSYKPRNSSGTYHLSSLTAFAVALAVFALPALSLASFDSECTGGTITHVGDQTVHTFLTSSTLECSGTQDVKILLVGGGGGGGGGRGGGGGGGGVVYDASFSVTGSNAVVIGSGGAAYTGDGSYPGASSTFSTLRAFGGGGGGSANTSVPSSPASGGGGGGNSTYYGAGGSQGNNGGRGQAASHYRGGGGGGAAAAGTTGETTGNGGAGLESTISGSSVYYGGGGGGGINDTTGEGAGGNGGGGAGGNDVNHSGYPGTANRGGGGGGSNIDGNTSSAGGSGIVIVSYTTPGNPLPVLTSIDPTSKTAGDPSFTLYAYGSGFTTSSSIKWDDSTSSIPTTYVSSSTLSAAVDKSLIAATGTSTITVYTPPAGGGTSSGISFSILAPPPPSTNPIHMTLGTGGLGWDGALATGTLAVTYQLDDPAAADASGHKMLGWGVCRGNSTSSCDIAMYTAGGSQTPLVVNGTHGNTYCCAASCHGVGTYCQNAWNYCDDSSIAGAKSQTSYIGNVPGNVSAGDKLRVYYRWNDASCGISMSTQDYATSTITVTGTATSTPIALVYPPSGSTASSNITNFIYSVDVPTSSVQYLEVRYGTSTALLGGHLWTNMPDTLPANVGIATDRASFELGTWYVQGYVVNRTYTDLYNYFDTTIATSSLDSFIVGSISFPNGVLTPPVNATSSLGCTNWYCDLFAFLFVPSDASLKNFSSVWDAIKTKPPIGYFSAIQAALGGIATSSTSTVAFPDLANLDSGLFSPIRSAISLLLWLMFGFWIFERFRHFNL